MYNVLFVCTANSARSIVAEVVMNHPSRRGKFRAFSAGSQPAGTVNPLAIDVLEENHYDVAGLRSKSWEEFAGPEAPHLDFVLTVCDNAAGEVCPIWPGQPMTAHWGVPDPAAVKGTDQEKRRAFQEALRVLRRRIDLFDALPMDKLSGLSLQERVRSIGRE